MKVPSARVDGLEKKQKITIFSILISLAITLVSGAFENILSEFWMGARLWGYILPWIVQVFTWPPQPKTVLWQNFVIDLVVWFIISFAVTTFFLKEKTK